MDSSSEEEDDRVGRFEWVERALQAPILHLVSSQLRTRENSPSGRFHLRFTLGCGEGEVQGKDAAYLVHLRQCIVEIRTKGCCADFSSAYSYELPEKVISDISKTEHSGSFSYGVQADAKLSAPSYVGIGTRLGAAFRGTRKRDRSDGRTTKFKRRIMLVAFHGAHWLVGDAEYGDPRNELGRLKERYFGEIPDLPMCAIDVLEGVDTAEICVELRAKFGHLDVEVLDALGRPIRRARGSDALDVSDAMKARVRGIALAKAIAEAQRDDRPGVRQPEREFMLSTGSLRVHMPRRSGDQDPSPAPDGAVGASGSVKKRTIARRRNNTPP